MNLPNKLTMFRIMLVPFIVILPLFHGPLDNELFNGVTLCDLIVLIIFCVASFTDFLDGNIARKYNLVTDFGKFMDPLADKLLVVSALIVLLEKGLLSGWIVTIIIAREFMVTGIRLLASSNNLVIAASKLGKAKTVSQMIMVIFLLLNSWPICEPIFGEVLAYIAAGLTLISGIDYFIKNRKIILNNK